MMQICSRLLLWLLLFFWAAVWCLARWEGLRDPMAASIRSAKSRAESLLADMLPADLGAFPLRSFWADLWACPLRSFWADLWAFPPPVACEGPGVAATIRGRGCHVSLLADASC